MAVIKLMPAEATIRGFKGSLDFYYNMGLPCVRAWPKRPGRERTPAVRAGWELFTYASQEWSRLSPEIQRTYEELATGSALSGRDMFQRAYMKGLYAYPLG